MMRRAMRRPVVAALSMLAGVFALACSAPEREAHADAHAVPAAGAGPAAAELPVVTVYKSPTCGCCKNWVEHLEKHGFRVDAQDVDDIGAVKGEHGVPGALQSCHTALAGGYVIEGHVPADLVQRLLAEKPEIAGLAVPGMPMGSPGMEGPYKDAYDVIAYRADGSTYVYAQR